MQTASLARAAVVNQNSTMERERGDQSLFPLVGGLSTGADCVTVRHKITKHEFQLGFYPEHMGLNGGELC